MPSEILGPVPGDLGVLGLFALIGLVVSRWR